LETRYVSVHPAKKLDEITDLYHHWGVALVTLDDRSLNHRLALPNKLFHAVHAGVPVVAADLPELRRVVSHYGLGALYRPGDPHSLVRAVRTIAAEYETFSVAVRRAMGALCWERDAAVLRKVYVVGPIGSERLSALYGGSRDKGVKRYHAKSGSGSIARTALQQLEEAGFLVNIKGRGRSVSPAGRKLLDNAAHAVKQDLVKEIPALAKY
jgi:hypothetical protein